MRRAIGRVGSAAKPGTAAGRRAVTVAGSVAGSVERSRGGHRRALVRRRLQRFYLPGTDAQDPLQLLHPWRLLQRDLELLIRYILDFALSPPFLDDD